jgi:ribosome biogenesis protein BMS1
MTVNNGISFPFVLFTFMSLHSSGNRNVGKYANPEVDRIANLTRTETDPEKRKARRSLNAKETLLYAPMSNVGAVLYDKDAVYIDLGGSHSHNTKSLYRIAAQSNNSYLNSIINTKNTLDEKLMSGKIKFLSNVDEIEDLEVVESTNDKKEENEERKRVAWGKNGAFNFDELEENDEDDEVDDDDEEDEEHSENEDEEEPSGSQSDEEEEEDEEDEEEDGEDVEFDDDEDEEDDDGEIKWKSKLKERAQMSFQNNNNKHTNWNKLIYSSNEMTVSSQLANKNGDDDFFTVKRSQPNEPINQDNSKYETQLKRWVQSNNEEDFESIRDCFVTGKWDENEDAENLLGDEDDDDPFGFGDGDADEEVYGDFEDYETGEVHKGKESDEDDEGLDDNDDNDGDAKSKRSSADEKKRKTRNEMTKRERLLEKKKRLKEQFDKNFDEKKLDEDPNENEYYDFMSKRAEDQSDLNRLEFEKMEDRVRVEYEGFRPGMYVRIEIKQMPYEFISNFNPHQLLVVGCLISNESNVGYVQVLLKKHRWYKKILKTKDPLIISLGWRRFQTLPLFYVQDHNMRNRALKYTPQHMHCQASFWGESITDAIHENELCLIFHFISRSNLIAKHRLLGSSIIDQSNRKSCFMIKFYPDELFLKVISFFLRKTLELRPLES